MNRLFRQIFVPDAPFDEEALEHYEATEWLCNNLLVYGK